MFSKTGARPPDTHNDFCSQCQLVRPVAASSSARRRRFHGAWTVMPMGGRMCFIITGFSAPKGA